MSNLKTGEIIVNSILILYIAIIVQMIPDMYMQIFNNSFVKIILLTLLVGISYRKPAIGILLAMAILISFAKAKISVSMFPAITEEVVSEGEEVVEEEPFRSLGGSHHQEYQSLDSIPSGIPSGIPDMMDYVPEELEIRSRSSASTNASNSHFGCN